jgi:hypothetical protein
MIKEFHRIADSVNRKKKEQADKSAELATERYEKAVKQLENSLMKDVSNKLVASAKESAEKGLYFITLPIEMKFAGKCQVITRDDVLTDFNPDIFFDLLVDTLNANYGITSSGPWPDLFVSFSHDNRTVSIHASLGMLMNPSNSKLPTIFDSSDEDEKYPNSTQFIDATKLVGEKLGFENIKYIKKKDEKSKDDKLYVKLEY